MQGADADASAPLASPGLPTPGGLGRRTGGPTRRERYERRQLVRSAVTSAISTLVFAAVLVAVVTRLESWPRVRDAFFNGGVFGDSFEPILRAFWLDVRIFLVCAPTILVLGLLVSLARSTRSPVLFPIRLLATVYVDMTRGVPVILWINLIGFGVVALINSRSFFGGYLFWGGVALVWTYSAYVSEVFRAGIESVHESQRAGARSLGLSAWQTNVHVVLPQAVRRVVPPLMNDFVSLQKDVALVSLLGPVEALRRADIIQDRTFNFTPFVVAALMFIAVAVPITRLADHLIAKERRQMSGTAVR
jgi:polar amino acid transport system permease protein